MNIVCELEKCLSETEEIQTVFVATDSEWDANRADPWQSTVISTWRKSILYATHDVPDWVRFRWEMVAGELSTEIVYLKRKDDTNLLADALGRLGIDGDVRLLLYFSPKDLEYALGWSKFKESIDSEDLRQRNNISGKVKLEGRKVYVKDLCGWNGKNSLKKFLQTFGLGTKDKGLMDDFKTCMWDGMLKHPEDYLRYSVADGTSLLELHGRFLDTFREIQKEVLGMDDLDLWDAESVPMTVGSLVARTFERWLYGRVERPDVLNYCVRKLGTLHPDAKHVERSRAVFNICNKLYRTVGRLTEDLDDDEYQNNMILRHYYKAEFLNNAIDAGSVQYWAGLPLADSAGYNALVQGGRCWNEDPYHYSLGFGGDIDISGCYGESLRSFAYPVGLPSVWSRTPNQTAVTLGQWLDKYESQLVDGLWTATVSGKLPFEQDLIHSKLVKRKDIPKAVMGDEDDDSDIPSNFVLLRREIQNGIITADTLRALRAVCSNIEWKSVRGLEIVCAAAYLADDRCDSLERWCEIVLADGGSYRMEGSSPVDDRTRAWACLPLEGFIGKLADERKSYKNMMNSATDDGRRATAKGMSEMLKTIINTFYGVEASRYFEVGNTVVANCITARARLGVWMLSKALGTKQCITDGGMYDPRRVCWFDSSRKPSLDTLSRPWEWYAPHRRRKFIMMDGWDWTTLPTFTVERDDRKVMDVLAKEHVRRFWETYGLAMPFDLEHKCFFDRAAYWGKGDYALWLPKNFKFEDGKTNPVYKLRGKKDYRKQGEGCHPEYELFDAILDGRDDFPNEMDHLHKSLLKIGKYREVQASYGYEELKDLRPGDEYVQRRSARFNNTHFPVNDMKEFENRDNRKRMDHGKNVRWFEKFGAGGIKLVHAKMATNDLRTVAN